MDDNTRKLAATGGVLLIVALGVKYVISSLFGANGHDRGGDEQPGGDVEAAPTPPGEVATITAVQAGVMADAIEQAIWGSGLFSSPTEDEDAVIDVITSCANTSDVKLLMNAYGKRGTITNKMNLAATVREYLSPSDIAAINADFSAKNIAIRF